MCQNIEILLRRQYIVCNVSYRFISLTSLNIEIFDIGNTAYGTNDNRQKISIHYTLSQKTRR